MGWGWGVCVKTPGSRPAGSEQTRAGEGQRGSSRSTNGCQELCSCRSAKTAQEGAVWSYPPPPPHHPGPHFSILVSSFCHRRPDEPPHPPSSQDRPACRLCCHCRSIFFLYCFFLYHETWMSPVWLLLNPGRGVRSVGLFFFTCA